MRSTITARGQTVIPAEIRQQFHLSPSDRLEWIVDASGIHVKPVKSNPVDAFRGSAKVAALTGSWLSEQKIEALSEAVPPGYFSIIDTQG